MNLGKRSVIAAVLIAASFAAVPVVEAATPPAVTAVIEGTDTSNGRGTLIVTGIKLNKFKTFSLTTFPGGEGAGTPTLLSKGKTQITVGLPAGLAAGDYTLNLQPRNGTPLAAVFSYREDRNAFEGDVSFDQEVEVGGDLGLLGNVIIGSALNQRAVVSNGTFNTTNSSGQFVIQNFGAGGGEVLLATLASAAPGVGPQMRFSDSTGAPFVDIGTNSAGDFEFENQFDQPILTAFQSTDVRCHGELSVGLQFDDSRLLVNGPVYADSTVQLIAADSNDAILTLGREDGTAVLEVGGGGSDDLILFTGTGLKPGGGSWGVFSDARLKKDVTDLDGALGRLLELRSVEYEYKDPASIHELPGRHVGFVAQEVEQVFPEWVGEKPDGMKYVAVKGFESLTVQALRELRAEKDAQIVSLAAKNAELERRLAELEASQEARIEALEKALLGTTEESLTSPPTLTSPTQTR